MDLAKPPTNLIKGASVEREVISDHERSVLANGIINQAGKALRPNGFEHQASIVVHLYKATLADHNFAFINQMVGLDRIPEGQADVALKELRRALMENYGREAPKERT